jgi:hypothetical protein
MLNLEVISDAFLCKKHKSLARNKGHLAMYKEFSSGILDDLIHNQYPYDDLLCVTKIIDAFVQMLRQGISEWNF